MTDVQRIGTRDELATLFAFATGFDGEG